MSKQFRTLPEEEVESFKQWARDNYKPFSEIQGYWHPFVQMECVRINVEANSDDDEEEFSDEDIFYSIEEQEEECDLEHHTGDGRYHPFLSNL
jgi:hypothetical protein